MITIPNDLPFRYVALDPGSNTLGVSLMEYEYLTDTYHVEDCFTLVAERQLGKFQHFANLHGERYAKLMSHYKALTRLFERWQPDAVVSESPYMGRYPEAFKALIETLDIIRQAVQCYDVFMPLYTLDPASVKQAVKVSGKSGDKSLMRTAVLGLRDLEFHSTINAEELDEHSIDSAAVGYGFGKFLHQRTALTIWTKESYEKGKIYAGGI